MPKEAEPVPWMSCNEDGFKAHRKYRDWVEKRNKARYATNAAHGVG